MLAPRLTLDARHHVNAPGSESADRLAYVVRRQSACDHKLPRPPVQLSTRTFPVEGLAAPGSRIKEPGIYSALRSGKSVKPQFKALLHQERFDLPHRVSPSFREI